jgi:hypothetical protein
VPMVLETPPGENERGHRRDLETLRGLAASDRRSASRRRTRAPSPSGGRSGPGRPA